MSDIPAFKKFVSEDEIEEQKKKRQEEWEKVRKPDQPLEAPEEVYDPRCLYDRLQEQKDKKQQEYEDAHKLRNQVKGLQDDEAQFLDFVSDKQSEMMKAREKETEEALNEYRNAVSSQTSTKKSPEKKIAKPATGPSLSKKSQSSLLAGAVKRKGSEPANNSEQSKIAKSDELESSPDKSGRGVQVAQVIGILPGLGAYSGSDSDSSNSSGSEDSDIDTRMFSKRVVYVEHKH